MRRGEILKLRWDQVDWSANLIRLEKKQMKAKQARVAPLYGELWGGLDMAYAAREKDCPFIVSWKGAGINEVKTAWNKARQRAKVLGLLVDRYDITDERDIQLAGQKLARYLEEKARTAKHPEDTDQSDENRTPGSVH
jgi:integrase